MTLRNLIPGRDKKETTKKLSEQVAPIDFPVASISDDWRSGYPKLSGTPTWYLTGCKGIIRKVVIGQQVITGGWLDRVKKELEAALAESGSEYSWSADHDPPRLCETAQTPSAIASCGSWGNPSAQTPPPWFQPIAPGVSVTFRIMNGAHSA